MSWVCSVQGNNWGMSGFSVHVRNMKVCLEIRSIFWDVICALPTKSCKICNRLAWWCDVGFALRCDAWFCGTIPTFLAWAKSRMVTLLHLSFSSLSNFVQEVPPQPWLHHLIPPHLPWRKLFATLLPSPFTFPLPLLMLPLLPSILRLRKSCKVTQHVRVSFISCVSVCNYHFRWHKTIDGGVFSSLNHRNSQHIPQHTSLMNEGAKWWTNFQKIHNHAIGIKHIFKISFCHSIWYMHMCNL